MTKITEEEWRDAMMTAGQDEYLTTDEGWYSVTELANLWGITRQGAYTRTTALHRRGVLEKDEGSRVVPVGRGRVRSTAVAVFRFRLDDEDA
jgi:DNA-binding IclR family transcriptional regulator